MTKQFKTAFVSFAVATLCILAAASQVSAFNLLDAVLRGKYAGSYGSSQKKVDHVQRCGTDCGGKGVRGPAQRSRVSKEKLPGPAQRGGPKKASGDHVQRTKPSNRGHVQRSTCAKGCKGSCTLSCHGTELMSMMRDTMTTMKFKLPSSGGGRSSGKGKGNHDFGGFDENGRPRTLSVPRMFDDTEIVPTLADPDHSASLMPRLSR